MKIVLALSALALAGSSTLVIAPDRAEAATAPSVRGATYTVDSGHSGALFRITHMGVAPFYGRFNRVTGEYVLDPDDASACSVRIAIDAESVDTNSEKRDQHIKSPDFFSAKEFPTITFESTRVSGGDDGAYRVTGDLTFHGVTKEVTASAQMIGQAETERGTKSGFEGRFTIDRTEFGLTKFAGALGNEVELILFIEGGKAE
jgi:polyisoprenoid-binding protein YceI